jgi:hypothetical protein
MAMRGVEINGGPQWCYFVIVIPLRVAYPPLLCLQAFFLIVFSVFIYFESFPEPSVLSRVTRRNIPEDSILHSHRRENLKSYIALTGWTL